MRVAMQEREQNCTTAHQRPILGATMPHQKKPQQYESLQKALHIFSGVNCPRGHSFHRPAVCTANLQTLVPPFFGETRESPAGTPSPCSWVWGTVAASANKPFVCSQPPHQLIPPTCPNLLFRHICTRLGKMSPDTEVKLNFKL